ncbi:hypothetical protein GGP96_002061 [Salinibacter ruber]|nr:hypothetical protein [Salinibacter ruber]
MEMSTYATLWTLEFPRDGDHYSDCDWIRARVQKALRTSGPRWSRADPWAPYR